MDKLSIFDRNIVRKFIAEHKYGIDTYLQSEHKKRSLPGTVDIFGRFLLHILQSLKLAVRLWSAGVRPVGFAFVELLVKGLLGNDGVCELDLLIFVIVFTDILS